MHIPTLIPVRKLLICLMLLFVAQHQMVGIHCIPQKWLQSFIVIFTQKPSSKEVPFTELTTSVERAKLCHSINPTHVTISLLRSSERKRIRHIYLYVAIPIGAFFIPPYKRGVLYDFFFRYFQYHY